MRRTNDEGLMTKSHVKRHPSFVLRLSSGKNGVAGGKPALRLSWAMPFPNQISRPAWKHYGLERRSLGGNGLP